MVDKLDIGRELPQKEWWRERPVAPATFFGFPDITKHGLRGGDLYVEQMDSVTLAVLADKCVKENIWDPHIWTKFSWRAQTIASLTHEPDLCYIFRAFARMDWYDKNLLTTYLGRIHRRLCHFKLPDVAVVLEAFVNPRFREPAYLQRVLLHLALLLQHRDDATVADLARCCAALGALQGLPRPIVVEVRGALELLAEALLLRDLSELTVSRNILVLNCYVSWGMVGNERTSSRLPSSTSPDLCWALVRELKGRLRSHGQEKPEEFGILATAMARGGFDHEDLWQELLHNLEHEAHRLPGHACASAVYGATKAGRCPPSLYRVLARRISEEQKALSTQDCARAVWGFVRGPLPIAEEIVLQGPVSDRILEVGFSNFTTRELVLTLDGLARAPARAQGVEALGSLLFEALHARLDKLSAEMLASVTRCLTYLRPESPEVVRQVLDAAAQKTLDAAATGVAAVGETDGGDAEHVDGAPDAEDSPDVQLPAPRHFAMLCQGLVGQPADIVPDISARVEALLPALQESLSRAPSAVSAAQILGCLVRIPGTERRNAALDTCAEMLVVRAGDLGAMSLVSLAQATAITAKSPVIGLAWTPPPELLHEVHLQLDMKRYDLKPGTLWKAARALSLVDGPELRLEERDEPEARRKRD